MASWRFVLTDPNFIPVGEVLNADNRRVSLALNKSASASFQVRQDNPLTDLILQGDHNIKAYRDGMLLFFGPIMTAEETASSDGQAVSVNCFDPSWILSKRLAVKTTTGQTFTNTDRAAIILTLINDANNDPTYGTKAHTHISVATTWSSGSSVTYTVQPYTPIMSALNALSAGVDGFDWRIEPLENFDSGQIVIADSICYINMQTVIGVERPAAIFELGTGKNNLASYTRRVDRTGQVDRAYAMSGTNPSTIVSATYYPLVVKPEYTEELIQTELTDSTMRLQLVREHSRIRTFPRNIITFEPHIDPRGNRMPQYGSDFLVGDSVIGRAVVNGSIRFDAMFRVWAVDFQIDNAGVERMGLVVEEESA